MRTGFISAILMASLTLAAEAQQGARPAELGGHPNLNGIWQAMNSAYWNLEAHSAEAIDEFWPMGAIAAIPAGNSVITGNGKIPYLPEALALREQNKTAGRPP